MKKASEFDNILDECLERVLNKGETIEQCLEAYPGYAAELEPLLQTALETKDATAIKPRPEFRERASYQFQKALREMESKRTRHFFGWQPRWATAVIVVIVLLLAGSSTVAASGNSMPDEPLYPVKLATEAVRLTLTPSALGKTELYAKLADKRVAEIIKMADEGKVEQVERATHRLSNQLVAMASLAVPGGEEPAATEAATFEAAPPESAVEEAPQAQLRGVAPTPAPAPAPVEEVPQAQMREAPPVVVEEAPVMAAPRALGTSEQAGQGKGRGGNAKAGDDKGKGSNAKAGDDKGKESADKGEGNGDNGKGSIKDVEPDERAQLKVDLSRRAAKNQEALEAVLEKASESVKPALRRAIEVAGAGYEQALRNLD